jgi:hypothetical protein
MAKVIKVAGSSAKPKKTKKTKITSVTIRESRGKDLSPSWEGWETFTESQFLRHFHSSMQYYNLLLNTKDLKLAVVEWMTVTLFEKTIIDAFRNTKDWQCSTTMGSVARCFLKGMPEQRDDFNNGRNIRTWLEESIQSIIAGNTSTEDTEDEVKKMPTNVISIQERVREATFSMTEEIEDAIEHWMEDPDKFDPKQFKVLNLLKGKEAKPAHARVIKEYYSNGLQELIELTSGEVDEDLKEGYSNRSKKQISNLLLFYKEIDAACIMLMEEAKVTRKPRVKKTVPKDKLVEKLKFLKTNEPLKLVSINPVEIIGSTELWIYNTRTRKLGRYIADEMTGPLMVKGSSIIGFDEHKSIQKTIRKPDEKLVEFKKAGKVQLRKFLDDINATDTKMNGRISEDIILLKVSS